MQIQTKEKTYLIPYSDHPEWTGLENGKVYEQSEVWNILKENYGELPNLEESDPESMGGPSYYQDVIVEDFLYQHEKNSKKASLKLILPAIGTGIFIISLLIVINFIKRRRDVY